jgi:hypothetical protein
MGLGFVLALGCEEGLRLIRITLAANNRCDVARAGDYANNEVVKLFAGLRHLPSPIWAASLPRFDGETLR